MGVLEKNGNKKWVNRSADEDEILAQVHKNLSCLTQHVTNPKTSGNDAIKEQPPYLHRMNHIDERGGL